MKQKMKKRKGEVDWFMLLMIGVFVVISVISAIRLITGNNDKTNEKGSKPKVVNSRDSVLEINGNSTVAKINTKVKILIKKEVAIVKKTSPDRGEPEVITIDGKYAVTSFDQTGSWNIDMYSANDILIDWIKVIVY